MAQLDKYQTKNMQFIRIRVGLDEMNQWVEDNPNASVVLPRMTGHEGELNYVSIANIQKEGVNFEKDLNNSLGICAKIQKESIILNIKCHIT
jgi:hypothetical protein